MEEKTYGEMLVKKILGAEKDGNGKINIKFGTEIAKLIPGIKMPKEDQINFGVALFHVLEETLADTFYCQEQEILTIAIKNLIYREDEKEKNNARILLGKIGDIAKQECKPHGEKALNLIIKTE